MNFQKTDLAELSQLSEAKLLKEILMTMSQCEPVRVSVRIYSLVASA